MRRTILSALALVIALAFAAESKAAQQNYDLAGTAWVGTAPLDGKQVPAGMAFRADGGFVFMVEVDGKLDKVEGTYTIEGSQLKIKIGGMDMDMTLVSLDADRLVTSGRNGQNTWYRVRQ